MRRLFITAALSLLIVGSGRAQGTVPPDDQHSTADPAPSRLRTGNLVRLRLPAGPDSIVGRITAIEGDTLVIAPYAGDPVRTAIGDAAEISVYRRGRTAARWTQGGAAVGFLAGSGLYLSWCAHNRAACRADDRAEARAARHDEFYISEFLFRSFGGALLGAALGYAMGPQEWEVVNRPLRLGIMPSQRGLAVAGTLSLGRR